MKDMKPIAMKCSEEQFNQIKPILQEYGMTIRGISFFKHYPYLTNNLDDVLGRVSNTFEDNKSKYNRTVFEEWDQDIFLQHCGIETKPKFIPIAMKCTMEQFLSIKPILLEHGKSIIHLITNDFDTRCYLINYHYHDIGITNLSEESYYIDEARVRCETWDGDLFLKNCGINVKQNKEDMKMVYTRSVEDMMKIHNVACDVWKRVILKEYIQKVNPYDGMIEVTEKQIDAMFIAATPAQVPVLEEVFGKQKKEIDWSRIKTGSKVMIEYTRDHCYGFNNIDRSKPVDVVFWKTTHFIQGDGKFQIDGRHSSYCTFHQNGNYALFSSNRNIDYVIEVIEY
jgi:hypothetical protein